MWKTRRPRLPGGGLTAFADESSAIEGKCTFSGTVMLNGRFQGEIVSTDTLIVGEKGVVHANIQAATLVVSGELIGNVVASERVELRGRARLFGDVEAPVFVVAEGVVFEGRCRMPTARTAAAATQAEAAGPADASRRP